MMLCAHSLTPKYGENYQPGYIGFQFTDNSFVSIGIAWFERWDDYEDIPVSHAFVVAGEDRCVEALAGGVTSSALDERFADPHTHVFFRKPMGWDSLMGLKIALAANSHIGETYGFGLIVADALAGSFLGHWAGKICGNGPNRMVSAWLDRRKTEICSELAAKALQAIPQLAALGCLKSPAREITPQRLFGDQAVFQAWHNSS